MANWHVAERRLGKLFGTTRRALSGGLVDGLRDDCKHTHIYLESKHQSKSWLWQLWDKAIKHINEERGISRIPVLGIFQKSRPGVLLVVHEKHLERMLLEYAVANGYTITKGNKDVTCETVDSHRAEATQDKRIPLPSLSPVPVKGPKRNAKRTTPMRPTPGLRVPKPRG